ncbi:hypothetical protein cypCar_00043409 [Cyprinus carpio]|nr:hypothetical protein cypCar_00043409 [Cyprinus carpio]
MDLHSVILFCASTERGRGSQHLFIFSKSWRFQLHIMALWKSAIVPIVLYICGCNSQSQDKVDQHTRIQFAFEGDTVTINCTYQTAYGSPTLFWYQQKVNGIPKHMLYKVSKSGNTAVFGNVIKPNKINVFAEEGSSVTLSCSFTDSSSTEYLHWYRQYGKSKPEFLVLTYDTKKDAQRSDVDPRFSVNISKSQYVDLKISSAAVSDSALYYCALAPTVTGNASALYKNLLQ